MEWEYDGLGRRIRQTTSVWTNGSWQVTEDLKLISDPVLFGRHIAEQNATNNALLRGYVWGLDLSGTLAGAGGVGGLLFFTHHDSPLTCHFAAYDGNGNVVGLISSGTGTETARYEYGPFGEPIRVTGSASRPNPLRFSTKRTDDTTDLVLYEYRAYNPALGRWLNRDPIGEQGGNNLYNFTANDPLDYIDTDGRFTATKCSVCGQWYQGYHKCPGLPPPPPDPVGFALCMRNVNPEGLGEHLLLIGFQILHPRTPTDHAYLHYKHCDQCERVGWGIGGTKPGAPPIPEKKFNPNDCKPCKRTASLLQYGALGRKGTEATDAEILECISQVPTSKPYKPTGKGQYNCLDWAKEAASKCGLDCN